MPDKKPTKVPSPSPTPQQRPNPPAKKEELVRTMPRSPKPPTPKK